MSTVTEKELKVLSDIIHTAYTDILSSEAWPEIFSLIARIVPLDAASAAFFDAETGSPGKCIIQNADPGFYRQYQEYYYAKDLPSQQALARNIHVWRPTDIVQKRIWENSEIYTDLLAPRRFYHAISVTLGTGREIPAQFWMVRTTPRHGFTDEDVQVLEFLWPHLTSALCRAKLLEDTTRVKAAFETGLDHFGRPIFLFDDCLRLIYMNQAAKDICEGGGVRTDEALASICGAVSELIGKEDHTPDGLENPTAVKCDLGNRTYMLEASSVLLPNSSRYWVVMATDMTDFLSVAVRRAVLQHGLSSREGEICTMLVGGLSNRGIAGKLFLSEFTVKDHVKNIFEKLEISSRSEVAARLLGL